MKQRIDLTGQRFNRLTVLRFDHTGRNGSYWLCRCDCGTEKVLPGYQLRGNVVKSCGCARESSGNRGRDLTGEVFGQLTVIRQKEPGLWLCRCACGNEVSVERRKLTSGNKKTCGCGQKGGKGRMIDITGQRFGMLTVLRKNIVATREAGHGMFDCVCDCGREKTLPGFNLRSGGVTSCGCQRGRPGIKRDVAEFTRKHGCSVCADKKSCDMTSCKYEKELIT